MRSKKVGILTFSYSSNPGSVLQAYALQQTLSEKMNCDVHIINYQKQQAGKPIIGKTVFAPPLRNWTARNIIRWIGKIVEHPIRMRPYKKFFKRFYNGYPTKRCLRQDLSKLEDVYDKFIVGSDQVWNVDSWNVDETYFLDFVTNGNKKISYAASLGSSEIPENKIELVKKLISEFSHISVRESTSVEVINNLVGKDVTLVLDPSLLLNQGRYLELAVKPKEEKYVLLYLREDSPELEKKAKQFAECHGLGFVKILKHWKCAENGRPLKGISPQQWLGYVHSADFVVTNSFHGICFSIIFEKQFYVDFLKKVSTTTNSRMQNILSLFGLEARGICSENNIQDMEAIDYNQVNARKEILIDKSLDYLQKSLETE